MSELNRTDAQRLRASARLSDRQREPEELVRDLREWVKCNPDFVRANALKMHERVKWLYVNDPEWRKTQMAKSLANVRSCYDTGPGYGRCSIASNGMWCASQPERNMAEWLIDQGVEFEMHKVLDNGRICDFYFAGLYWEMDGMDRDPAYFAEKYGALPYAVVTPEDFKYVVESRLAGQHVYNGDPIVAIEPCGEEVTYDIEMAPGGPLNYIANKVVSHNSHAAAYSLVSYQTAYLKANYPSEYMSAFLTVAMGNPEKIAAGIAECKRMGIDVLPPDLNRSEEGFSLEPGEHDPGRPVPIRFGLSAIKNVGTGPIRAILEERAKLPDNAFKSLDHLCQQVDARLVNKRVLESLIKAGAMDSLGTRAQLMAVLDDAMTIGQRAQRATGAGQMSLFGGAVREADEVYVPSIILPAVPDTPREQALSWEKEMLGLYISDHPLTAALAGDRSENVALIAEVGKELVGQQVRIVGMLSGTKVLTTKKKQSMLVAKLEDLTGSLDFVAFPESYEKFRELLRDDAIVEVAGKLDERNESLQLICDAVRPYDPAGEAGAETPDDPRDGDDARAPAPEQERTQELRILVPTTADMEADIERMHRLYDVLKLYPGSDRITLQVSVGQRSVVVEPYSLDVLYSAALERDLEAVLGGRHWRLLDADRGDGRGKVA
jgi:hypothetical protein